MQWWIFYRFQTCNIKLAQEEPRSMWQLVLRVWAARVVLLAGSVMMTLRLPLEAINDGFAALEQGNVARALVVFDA